MILAGACLLLLSSIVSAARQSDEHVCVRRGVKDNTHMTYLGHYNANRASLSHERFGSIAHLFLVITLQAALCCSGDEQQTQHPHPNPLLPEICPLRARRKSVLVSRAADPLMVARRISGIGERVRARQGNSGRRVGHGRKETQGRRRGCGTTDLLAKFWVH
jgi:hypothetical protein